MGYNSAKYIHTVYQAMNLAFADRDFYYGDPYFLPQEPMAGLLNKEYARQRAGLIRDDRNDPQIAPGDPYPFEGKTNPWRELLRQRSYSAEGMQERKVVPAQDSTIASAEQRYQERLHLGTTSVEAADEEGWVVSITPSGGWLPACIAGHTGVGLSQRMQSFVLDSVINPFNVLEPGKRPRVTLTPTLALKEIGRAHV